MNTLTNFIMAAGLVAGPILIAGIFALIFSDRITAWIERRAEK